MGSNDVYVCQINSTFTNLHPLSKEGDVTISSCFEDSIVPTTTVLADEDRITQAITNVMANSIKV